MVIASVTITPISEGVSVSKYVKVAYKNLVASGLKIQLTPMATIIEADNVKEIFEAVQKAHEAVQEMGLRRIITEVKIDDRRDKKVSMMDKVKSVIG